MIVGRKRSEVPSYDIVITSAASRQLTKIAKANKSAVVDIDALILGLADERHPPGSKKLTGHDLYRGRTGDFRVVYSVDDEKQTVTIEHIGDRKDIYDKL
jgi:mRNA interferase RelE/StbE